MCVMYKEHGSLRLLFQIAATS